MSHVATGFVVRQLGSLFEGGSASGLSDRQLLERFLADGRDPAGEAAFAAIVGRHGPMVLGLCRQLLGDAQHAEDAFQAVFLVLARKASAIRDPDLLGNWLYGVAIRTARCARQQLVRRRRREEGHAMTVSGASPSAQAGPTAPPADRPAIDREQAEALHAEVDRLPASSRLPVVLCYFEGLTIDEAARRLRCPAGTLHSRLARAREKLRVALARRGIVLPAAAIAMALAPRSASASVPPLLCDSTARAAIAFATQSATAGAGLAAPAATLAQEVLKTMLFHKLRLVTMTVLALAAVATGAGYHALNALAEAREGEPPGEPLPNPARTEPRPPGVVEGQPAPNAARMTVAGRVLDPDGKPVKGAFVDVVGALRTPWVGASEETSAFQVLGQAESDADGRFQFEAPRTSSSRVPEILAIATAPGFGRAAGRLNPDAERPEVTIRLQPEAIRRARLLTLSGAPAAGVVVHVQGFYFTDPADETKGVGAWLGQGSPPAGLRAWPKPIKSDDQGRIVLTGFGPAYAVQCDVRDIPYARQDLPFEPVKPGDAREVTMALQPARVIEGRVLAADTGQPIPNAVVSAKTRVQNERANGFFTTKFRADDQGRFVMNPIPGDSYTLGAFPTGGQPYLIAQDEMKWTKGALKATHDIRMTRGVLIRGKVTEQGTGRPLPASSIQFIPVGNDSRILSGWQAIVASGDDGSFDIAVPPGKGHLLVYGPTGDYILDVIGSRRLYDQGPGGWRYRAHAIIPYEVKAGDRPLEVAAALRPGVTIRGRVEGPDGQTIARAMLITALRVEAYNPYWRGDYQDPVSDGRFELHGLDPKGTARIHILDADHEWGATVEVSGNRAGEERTVRLQPCGKAKARFVGPDGKPVAKYQPTFEFVATPGPNKHSLKPGELAELSADSELMANVDRKHYWNQPRTDAEGRVTFVSLIPGALYRLSDFSTINEKDKGQQTRKDITVKPGETIDLGDILIEKP